MTTALPIAPAVPDQWLPPAAVARLIFHWTAGTHIASPFDRLHYHFLIEGDGRIVRGARAPGKYLPHTRKLNSGSIGIALCGMHQAVPGKFGPYPLTPIQFHTACRLGAQLFRRYHLAMAEKTCLVHADVGRVYGIPQRGKWDISHWPGDEAIHSPEAVSHKLRVLIGSYLAR